MIDLINFLSGTNTKQSKNHKITKTAYNSTK